MASAAGSLTAGKPNHNLDGQQVVFRAGLGGRFFANWDIFSPPMGQPCASDGQNAAIFVRLAGLPGTMAWFWLGNRCRNTKQRQKCSNY
jgi:hypothetical protein